MNDSEYTDILSREIQDTRQRIEFKAADLKSSLTPPSVTHLKDTFSVGGKKMLESFRDNPIPVTLVGAGLGWMLLRDARTRRNPDGLPEYKPESSMSTGKIKQAVRSAGEKVAEGVSSVKDSAIRGAHKASDWFNATLQDNPLILAVGSLGLGLIAGLSIPISQAEKDTAGKLGEKLVGKVLDKGADALESKEEPAAAQPNSDTQAGL